MSCGVNYEFSLVATPKAAKLVREEIEVRGTPEDAVEQGAIDPRRSGHAAADLMPGDAARGRRARGR